MRKCVYFSLRAEGRLGAGLEAGRKTSPPSHGQTARLYGSKSVLAGQQPALQVVVLAHQLQDVVVLEFFVRKVFRTAAPTAFQQQGYLLQIIAVSGYDSRLIHFGQFIAYHFTGI